MFNASDFGFSIEGQLPGPSRKDEMGELKRGQMVRYSTGSSDVEALVERLHRDGTVTVQARFFLDKSGDWTPGFLGYHYRLSRSALRVA